jgi:6-phosphogluconolactonase
VADERPWIEASNPVDAATERLMESLEVVIEARGEARLAISGGSVARVVGDLRRAMGAKWECVALTWVDERCAPLDHADSNRGAAYRDGQLDRSDPCGFELGLFLDGETPDQAVTRVDSSLLDRFDGALDVNLLGMGEDGHVASLFPGKGWEGPRRAIHISDSPKPPLNRISMTRSMLATARLHLLLAMGEGKRDSLRRLRFEDPALPATGLAGLEVVTDQSVEEAR